MKKILLTLVCLLTVGFAGWADSTTWTCSSLGSSTISDISTQTFSSGEIKFKAAKGSNATTPAYNKSGDVRLYAGNTLDIYSSNPDVIINSVTFNISTQGKKRLTDITASAGTIANQATGDTEVNWTGNAASITFTVGEKTKYGSELTDSKGNTTAGQLCFDSVEITYTISSSTAKKVTLSFPESKYEITLGETFPAPTVTADPAEALSAVVYSISENDFATIDAKTGAVTLLEGQTGNATVTASIASDNTNYFGDAASYILKVSKPIGDSGDILFDFTAQGYANQQEVKSLSIAPATVYFDIEGNPNSNTSKYYTTGTAVRVYGGNSFKIIADEGYELVSASIKFSQNPDSANSITASTGTYSYSNLFGTWTTTLNVDEVTFKVGGTNGNVRIQSITVAYAKKVEAPQLPAAPVISSIMANEDDTFSQPDGIQIDIDTAEAGTRVYYTLDGSDPKCDVNGNKIGSTIELKYTTYSPTHASFYISGKTTTVKAMGYKDGKKSPIATKTFTFVENNAKILGFMVEVGDDAKEAEYIDGLGYSFEGEVESNPFEIIAITEDDYNVWYHIEKGGMTFKTIIGGQCDGMNVEIAENGVIEVPADGNTYTVFVCTEKNDVLSVPIMLTVKATVKVATTPEAPKFSFGDSEEEIEHGATISHKSEKITLHFNLADGHQLFHAHKPIVKNEEETPAQKPARVAAETVEKNGLTFTNVTNQIDTDGNLTLDAKNGEYHFFVRNGEQDSDVKMFNLDVTVGVASIDAENGVSVYFNLQGQRVANPEKGIYIRVSNGEATKVVL